MTTLADEIDTALAHVEKPSSSRLAVKVSRDAERQIRGGHPWVFDRAISSISDGGTSGDLAVVFDHDRAFCAIGLYDPDSPIRLKILHQGKPATIDDSFWAARAREAHDRRASLFADRRTTGFRLINGENDGFPGLVADLYATTLVVKVYSSAWFPHLASVLRAVLDTLGEAGCTRVVLRLSRAVLPDAPDSLHDGSVLAGEHLEGVVEFLENGLRFNADVLVGQKTGYFLDQRDNRKLAAEYAKGADVLDVFSCSGGFSITAAAAGAKSVHSVDISPHAIKEVFDNRRLNIENPKVEACHFDSTVGDAFEILEGFAREGRQFDLVIIDPPSFASKKRHIDNAVIAYKRLAGLGARVTKPGGMMLQASCSSRVTTDVFRDAVRQGASAAGYEFSFDRYSDHGIDHPVSFPEGSYLKAAAGRPRRRPRRR